MKKFIIASLAVLTLASAAEAAPRGAWVGDGKTTPREIIDGKPADKRVAEIVKWMYERGAKHNRFCNAKEKTCTDSTTLVLKEGGFLMMRVTENLADKSQSYINYCRSPKTMDTSVCYNFGKDVYFGQIYDSESKKWVHAFTEGDEQDSESAETKDADILM